MTWENSELEYFCPVTKQQIIGHADPHPTTPEYKIISSCIFCGKSHTLKKVDSFGVDAEVVTEANPEQAELVAVQS